MKEVKQEQQGPMRGLKELSPEQIAEVSGAFERFPVPERIPEDPLGHGPDPRFQDNYYK
jgi:hypothetical protein